MTNDDEFDFDFGADDSDEPEVEETPVLEQPSTKKPVRRPALSASGEELILGMTSVQRLVIATMLFLNTCTLGFLCNLVAGRFFLPF